LPNGSRARCLRARLEVAKDTGVAHVVEASAARPDGKPIFL
jgi:hypothetical protein